MFLYICFGLLYKMENPESIFHPWFAPFLIMFVVSSFSFVYVSVNDTVRTPAFVEHIYSAAVNTLLKKKPTGLLEELTAITDTFEPLYCPPNTGAFRSPLLLSEFPHPRYIDPKNLSRHSDTKIVMMFTDGGDQNTTVDGTVFEGCPESRCVLTQSKKLLGFSTAVIINSGYAAGSTTTQPELKRAFPEQMFVYYQGESPIHGLATGWAAKENFFNWTMTYRTDSDISAHYTYAVKLETEKRNFAHGKMGLIAWVVSNCNADNAREKYVQELQKYLPVNITIVGKCSKNPATRYLCRKGMNSCAARLMRAHKFYIAFENSNCGGYLTEKPMNALQTETVPIVMGNGNYRDLLPPKSFINVAEFKHPKQLAKYLLRLDANDDLYNDYMKWRYNPKYLRSSGQFSAEKNGFCKLCEKIHLNYTVLAPKMYKSVNEWSHNAEGRCTAGFWIKPDGTNLYSMGDPLYIPS